MTNWFHRKHAAKACTECGGDTVRTSGLCQVCEREDARRSIDAQRGFSIELGEYVRIPRIPSFPHSVDDAHGGALQE